MLMHLFKIRQALLSLLQRRLAVFGTLHEGIPLADTNVDLGLLSVDLRRPRLEFLLLDLDLVVIDLSLALG